MTPRDLLAGATPRPWTDVFIGMVSAMPESFGSGTTWNVTVAKDTSFEDKMLIVAAVNEYEALLDIAEAAAGVQDARDWPQPQEFGPFVQRLDRVKDMLARLDAVRSGS